MSCTGPGVTPYGGPVERMLVLEPLEHSVPVIMPLNGEVTGYVVLCYYYVTFLGIYSFPLYCCQCGLLDHYIYGVM